MAVSAIGKPVVIKEPSNTLAVLWGDAFGNAQSLGSVTDCNSYLVLPILPYSANWPAPGRAVPEGELQLEPNRDARAAVATAQPSRSFISNVSWDDGHKVCAVQPLHPDPQHP